MLRTWQQEGKDIKYAIKAVHLILFRALDGYLQVRWTPNERAMLICE